MSSHILARLQWIYMDELVAIGYNALRERTGKDETIQINGPNNEPYQLHLQIDANHKFANSVTVSCKIQAEHSSSNSSTLHASFTMLESGKIIRE